LRPDSVDVSNARRKRKSGREAESKLAESFAVDVRFLPAPFYCFSAPIALPSNPYFFKNFHDLPSGLNEREEGRVVRD
jgi:hypothetical protein